MRKRLVVSAAVANSTLVLIVNMLTKTKPKGVTGFVFMEMSPRSLITPKSIDGCYICCVSCRSELLAVSRALCKVDTIILLNLEHHDNITCNESPADKNRCSSKPS
jgi:hypothetical protein